MKNRRTQKGFTIIELCIATLLFSVLLAIIMSSFLGVGRMFVKGANLSLTQQDARNITDSISNDIRFSDSTPIIPGGQSGNLRYFCVGFNRYEYNLFSQVGGATYGLKRENVGSGCPDLTSHPVSATAIEMLSNGMQLNDFHFGNFLGDTCTAKYCKITINLLFYGADPNVFASNSHPTDTPAQALIEPDAHCVGSDLGTQFCATTSYSTTVLQSAQQDD